MRDILRWVLHWLSAGEQIEVEAVDYIVSTDVEMRLTAAGDIEMRFSAAEDVSL